MEIATQSNSTTILAQLEMANLNPEQMEGLLLPGELTDAEWIQEQALANAKGFMFTEGKYYSIHLEQFSALAQKCVDQLSETHLPKESKSLDQKESVHQLSFKESAVKEKELNATKSEKSESEHAKNSTNEKSAEKTKQFADEKLFNGKEALPKGLMHLSMSKAHAKEAPGFSNPVKKAEKQEDSREARNKEKPVFEDRFKQSEVKDGEKHQVERRKDEEKEKQKRDQQGFHEDQKQGKDEREPEKEEKGISVKKATFESEFIHYSNEDSMLSEIFKMKTSQFDVILLFLEIMKLAIKSREQERLSRWQERELQLFHMQKVVDNFKQQGKYQLIAGIGSGIFAIVSGMCPIVGHLKGDWIKDKISYVVTAMKDMETEKLFKSLTKMTFAMSEMQKSTGQIQNTFAEGSRSYNQHMLEIHKTDADESTRTMEDIKDHWKNIENFVYQSMQMYHDAIRQLYQ